MLLGDPLAPPAAHCGVFTIPLHATTNYSTLPHAHDISTKIHGPPQVLERSEAIRTFRLPPGSTMRECAEARNTHTINRLRQVQYYLKTYTMLYCTIIIVLIDYTVHTTTTLLYYYSHTIRLYYYYTKLLRRSKEHEKIKRLRLVICNYCTITNSTILLHYYNNILMPSAPKQRTRTQSSGFGRRAFYRQTPRLLDC